jgi:hypothetical protein
MQEQDMGSSSFPGTHPVDSPYVDEIDKSKHAAQIAQLASTHARPVQEVSAYYEHVLSKLRSTARIDDYLPVFVTRKVQEHLRHQV